MRSGLYLNVKTLMDLQCHEIEYNLRTRLLISYLLKNGLYNFSSYIGF